MITDKLYCCFWRSDN